LRNRQPRGRLRSSFALSLLAVILQTLHGALTLWRCVFFFSELSHGALQRFLTHLHIIGVWWWIVLCRRGEIEFKGTSSTSLNRVIRIHSLLSFVDSW